MTRSTILTVSKDPTDGNKYTIQLNKQGDGHFFASGARQFSVRVDQRAVAKLQEMIGQAVDSCTDNPYAPGVATEPFISLGKSLFAALLPPRQVEDLRREIVSDDSPLLIVTDDPDPLWEFMDIGNDADFMCLKRDVGRVLRMNDFMDAPVPSSHRRWKCLMVGDPTEDLPGAKEEVRQLKKWLESEHGMDCRTHLEGASANFGEMLRCAGGEYDIIHYAGHVKENPETGEFGMVLSGGEFFTPDNIRNFMKGGLVVFLNGCRSARVVKGLAEAFISVGARVVIGSLFETPDDGARVFAETFYAAALAGQTVGTAVRMAREKVRKDPAMAAAWACFIMYGDPTRQLDPGGDDLTVALKTIRFERGAFETGAVSVIEKAVLFATSGGVVSTSHLFAAMVGGEDPSLRTRLNALGVPVDSLQAAFEGAFRRAGAEAGTEESAERGSGTSFSQHTREIIERAKASALGAGRVKVRESDLVAGFVAHGGGAAGEILDHIGVRVADLALDAPVGKVMGGAGPRGDSPGTVVRKVGNIAQEDCTPEAWRVLLGAVEIAARTGSEQLSSPHLFWGMNQEPGGALARALQRLQTPITFGGQLPAKASHVQAEVTCSRNASEILLRAQALAVGGQRQVTGSDLLRAFVKVGGSGLALEKQGLILEALVSRLFNDEGALDMARFDEPARAVMEAALDCATKKRYPVLGRRHLLYGLLAVPGSLLATRIAAQGAGVDPELLADQMYSAMESGSFRSQGEAATYRTMSGDLVRMLCEADESAEEDSAQCVGEKHLLQAWINDGGGEMGVFLSRSGVKLRRLL